MSTFDINSTPRSRKLILKSLSPKQLNSDLLTGKKPKLTPKKLPSVKARILKTKLSGTKMDTITELHMKPTPNQTLSIYQHDYTLKDPKSYRIGRYNSSYTLNTEPDRNTNSDYTETETYGIGSPKGRGEPVNYTHENWEPTFRIERPSYFKTSNSPFPKKTLYKADFVQPIALKSGPSLKPDLWGAIKPLASIDFKTTNRLDYKDWNASPPEKAKDPSRRVDTDIPFVSGTTYKNEFVDWGPNSKTYERAHIPLTVISEVPFRGRTLYSESFVANNKAQKAPLASPKHGSPLMKSVPFLSETTYKSSFSPLKVNPSGNTTSARKNVEDFFPSSVKGNYKSLYKDDFKNPPERIYIGLGPSQ